MVGSFCNINNGNVHICLKFSDLHTFRQGSQKQRYHGIVKTSYVKGYAPKAAELGPNLNL